MFTDLTALLEGDLDTHLMTLKFLGMFPGDCRVELVKDCSGWASLVRFDAGLFAWDRQNYPEVREVVLVDGTAPDLVEEVLSLLGPGPAVVKASDPRAQKVLETRKSLTPVKRFLWYTTEGPIDQNGVHVREVLVPDPVFDSLLVENGYTSAEVGDFWSRQARGYVVDEEGRPRSFCLVYPNHGSVWEIGSLKTFPEARRQGFAAQVVRAAAGSILARGHRIRYHVDSGNLPSQALASAAGLEPRIETRHYLPSPGDLKLINLI